MFIGHWAPALVAAAHPKAPRLGILFLGAQLVDWFFFAFVLVGIEHLRLQPGISRMNPMDLYHMPYTHSLAGTLVFSLAFAALIWLATNNRIGALIGGAVVVSHWFADLLVHIPDLTLWGSPPKLGLGLWNYPDIAIPLELGLTAAAFALLIAARRPASLRALLPMAILALAMLAVQLINWFGPQPTEPDIIGAAVVFGTYGLISLIAEWADRRLPRTKDATQ